MALTRAALREMGITEKEIIDAVMTAHGETVEAVKEKANEAASKAAEKLQEKINALQEKIENMPESTAPDGKNWNAEYNALQTKYDTDIAAKDTALSEYKATIESEKTITAKLQALHKQLAADGANPKLIDLLESKFDLASVELDGDAIKGWDELSKPVKANYADVFGTTTTKGVDVATPPAGTGGDKNPWLKENFSLKEQTRIYRENPALAIDMARVAGIKLQ